jgi:hypothetical protein
MSAILWLFVGSDPVVAQAITRVATINTVAGNGAAGYSGDSGPATSAELNSPYGLPRLEMQLQKLRTPTNIEIHDQALYSLFCRDSYYLKSPICRRSEGPV